jgi:myo-inositol-hexaphosphate 3-phosphohydrolase
MHHTLNIRVKQAIDYHMASLTGNNQVTVVRKSTNNNYSSFDVINNILLSGLYSDAAYRERMILDEGVTLAFEILRG